MCSNYPIRGVRALAAVDVEWLLDGRVVVLFPPADMNGDIHRLHPLTWTSSVVVVGSPARSIGRFGPCIVVLCAGVGRRWRLGSPGVPVSTKARSGGKNHASFICKLLFRLIGGDCCCFILAVDCC